jgi:hypothetical protein
MVSLRHVFIVGLVVSFSGCTELGDNINIFFEETNGGGDAHPGEDGGVVNGDEGLGCDETFIDYDCDNVLAPCPEGTHRDFDPMSPCAICADNQENPVPCEAARERYAAFLDHIIPSSCADFCETVADCYVFDISNACSRDIIPLYGAIDEEIILVAEQFAHDNCAPVCGDVQARSEMVKQAQVACLNHQCVLQ